MVRKSLKKNLSGTGIGDQLFNVLNLTGQTENPSEYNGEKHAKGFNFLGPNTDLQSRERDKNLPSKPWTPINKLDAAAKTHDLAYAKSNQKIKNKQITQEQFMDEIHDADDVFIKELSKIPGISITKTLASKAILLKKFLEKNNILNPEEFSQSGTGERIMEQMSAFNIPPDNRLRKQKGGFLPAAATLIPWVAPVLASLATTAVEGIIKHFSKDDKANAQKGSGINNKYDTKLDDKKLYIAHGLDNMPPEKQIETIYKVLIK